MKAKDTLLLINTVTQNPILARTAWFWHVPSHISEIKSKKKDNGPVGKTSKYTKHTS